ncbi:MAG: mechanosensitive ion channel family protein [Gemmatimonadota bacterium]
MTFFQEANEVETSLVPSELITLPEHLAFLGYEVLGSSLLNWLVAALVLAMAHPALRLLVHLVIRRVRTLAAKSPQQSHEVLVTLLTKVRGWVIFVLALWLASLTLGPDLSARTARLAQIAVLLQIGLWSADILGWFLKRYRSQKLEEDPGAATALGAIAFLGRVVVWTIIVLMGFSLLGYEIGPALAGLGVGGIAIALAVQNILGDLFASLSIIFDRPFVIGDFIIVGEQKGTVEHVGLKTTRVRALSGEQLVFSNSDLLNSRIQNFKQMDERRILFTFGVQFDTGYEKLKQIPGIVKDVIEGVENTRFDRAHFATFADSSLDFEVVYFMTVPDFAQYRDAQQTINLEIYRRIQELGATFAFPTRTLHVQLDGADAELRTRLLRDAEPVQVGSDGKDASPISSSSA